MSQYHDSHECPNGTTPDGHCEFCIDPYWQKKGPELQDRIYALEHELATYRAWLAKFLEFVQTAPDPTLRKGSSPFAQVKAERYLSEMLSSIVDKPR